MQSLGIYWLHADRSGIADVLDVVRASRTKVAATWTVHRQWQLAGDRHQRAGVFICAGQGNRVKQPLCVGVTHLIEYLVNTAGFNRLAGVHHGDAVAGFQDQPEVVRYKQHGCAGLACEFLDQLNNARFNRYIQSGGWLVKQQQVRL